MNSLMSTRIKACSSSNRNSASALASSVFADAGRAEEDERADGPARVLQAGARAADSLGNGGERLVLADDAQAQAFLHPQQVYPFRFSSRLLTGICVQTETTLAISSARPPP